MKTYYIIVVIFYLLPMAFIIVASIVSGIRRDRNAMPVTKGGSAKHYCLGFNSRPKLGAGVASSP